MIEDSIEKKFFNDNELSANIMFDKDFDIDDEEDEEKYYSKKELLKKRKILNI